MYSADSININVRDNMVMYDRSKMTFVRTIDPLKVKVYSNQSALLDIAPECEITGVFIAPNCEVRLRDRVKFTGNMQAKKISFMSYIILNGRY